MQYGSNKEKIVSVLKANIKNPYFNSKITKAEYDTITNSNDIEIKQSKNLYHIELHKGKNPNEYDYLDRDNPITTNQINKIENQIEKENYKGRVSIVDGRIYKTIGDVVEIKKGGDIYSAFAGDDGFTPKLASMFLLRACIDGIKFRKDGSTNYIVFDDKNITINKKVKL